jgi:phospholipase/carboxylesterase
VQKVAVRITIAARFAQPPRLAPPHVALHLLHGDQDRLMPPPLAEEAAPQWRSLGGQAMLEWFPGLGHAIDTRVAQRAAEALGAQMP